jgi:hypothetical protein
MLPRSRCYKDTCRTDDFKIRREGASDVGPRRSRDVLDQANREIPIEKGRVQMPEVFSVYNRGTSHNRQNLDETVADLARRTAGAENRDWMINDGPGSYSHHAGKSATALKGLAAQAKTPGTRDPISRLKEGSTFAVIRGVASGMAGSTTWTTRWRC